MSGNDIRKFRNILENVENGMSENDEEGFIDVSDKSKEQVKRMGQKDEPGPTKYAHKVQNIAFYKIPFNMKNEFKQDIQKHSDIIKYFFNGKDGKHPSYPNHWAIVYYTKRWLKKGEQPRVTDIYKLDFQPEVQKTLDKYKEYYVDSVRGSYKKY